jgi:Ca2+-binding RTX toxin-like protein
MLLAGASEQRGIPTLSEQTQPMAAVLTVTSSDGLLAALKTAHNGDTILLAPGNYGDISLYNVHTDGVVTIQSADSAHLATASSLTLNQSSGLAFSGLDVALASGGNAVAVMSSSNIALSGLKVHGVTGVDQGVGAMVRDSTGVTISGSDFTALGSGIGHLNSSTIAFTNNTFHNLETDGIFGGGSSHVVVSGNSFTEFHPLTGDHPDAIQFWGATSGAPGTDVTITDNVITRGAGDPIQGIFIEYTNGLNISGNAMTGTMTNGISLSGSNNAVVEDNLVQGSSDTGARIIVRDGSTNVTVTGNTITEPVVNLQQTGSLPNVNFTASGNTLIAQASVGDTSTLNAWVTQHSGVPIVGTFGSDVLTGGAGSDLLVSIGGIDTMTGGAGADTFYFLKAPAAVDLITDFTSGQDTLDLHTLLTNYGGTNPVADQWVKFQTDSTGTTVYVDADGPTGAGGFVAVAKLAGVTSLASTDWVFH